MSSQSKRLVSRFKAAEGFVPPQELVGIGDRGGERLDGDQLTFKLSFRRKKSLHSGKGNGKGKGKGKYENTDVKTRVVSRPHEVSRWKA